MEFVVGFFAFALGGLGRRIAGGVLNQWFRPNGGRVTGDLPVRLFFGATVAVSATLAGAVWWQAAALIICIWLGTTIGMFESLSMGRGRTSFLHDFIGMTLHGLAGVVLGTVWAWYLGYAWWYALAGGLLIGPAYTLGYRLAETPRIEARMPVGVQGGTEFGEVFYGGLVALGMVLAVACRP